MATLRKVSNKTCRSSKLFIGDVLVGAAMGASGKGPDSHYTSGSIHLDTEGDDNHGFALDMNYQEIERLVTIMGGHVVWEPVKYKVEIQMCDNSWKNAGILNPEKFEKEYATEDLADEALITGCGQDHDDTVRVARNI
tara:strand:- start:2476 stop:2889 length:414 start_codon:yes stop_codon:yes gene_type:complete